MKETQLDLYHKKRAVYRIICNDNYFHVYQFYTQNGNMFIEINGKAMPIDKITASKPDRFLLPEID